MIKDSERLFWRYENGNFNSISRYEVEMIDFWMDTRYFNWETMEMINGYTVAE